MHPHSEDFGLKKGVNNAFSNQSGDLWASGDMVYGVILCFVFFTFKTSPQLFREHNLYLFVFLVVSFDVELQKCFVD